MVIMTAEETWKPDCEICHRRVSVTFRCSQCRRRVCRDCLSHLVGLVCVECNKKGG